MRFVLNLLLMSTTLLFNNSTLGSPLLNCEESSAASVQCGQTPSSVLNEAGLLFTVFVKDQHVYLVMSKDLGLSFSAPIRINQTPEAIYHNGENRPKIVLGLKGQIYVSWSKITEGRFNGDIRFVRSVDGGLTFSSPLTVNDDKLLTGHRFDVMALDHRGRIYLAWIDKRDKQGDPSAGASVYYAVSVDGGISFSKNRAVLKRSCQCCRIAMASAANGVAILWRQIFDTNSRDHAFAVLGPTGISEVKRATRDQWQIDACPHHGPAMVSGKQNGQNRYHLVWFTDGDVRSGIFYGRLNTLGDDPENIRKLSGNASASHPDIAIRANRITVVWKEFDGEKTLIKLLLSEDAGLSWGSVRDIAVTSGGSDHPLLVQGADKVWLSWKTGEQGYRFVDLDGPL